MNIQPPIGTDLAAEMRRIVLDLNRFVQTIPDLPEFQDDQAAEAGRVKIGEGYVTPAGVVRRRMA